MNQMQCQDDDNKQWFVLRDLKRPNAKRLNWLELQEAGFEVFTPMHWMLYRHSGKVIRKHMPVITDLLFVYTTKSLLDPIINKTPTLQYRYLRNHYMKPMTVSNEEMRRFIIATEDIDKVKYYTPEEMETSMKGKPAKVIGGPLNGYEGIILSVRGSKVRRLFVEIPGLIAAGVEVSPEFIKIFET